MSEPIPTTTGRRIFHGQAPMHFETVYDALLFALDQVARTIEDAANGRPSDLLIPQLRICADLIKLCADKHEHFIVAEHYPQGATQ